MNVRDWLYVTDHCEALRLVLSRGRVGETYNIGGNCEKTNLEVVRTLCAVLDELFPDSPHRPHDRLITFVKDRPGHDRRYAINISKISRELGWRPRESFESGFQNRGLVSGPPGLGGFGGKRRLPAMAGTALRSDLIDASRTSKMNISFALFSKEKHRDF